MKITPSLKTERLRLYAPFHRAFDIEQQVSWLNDKETMKWSGQRHGHHTLRSQASYIASFDHHVRHYWEISHSEKNDQAIGTITAYRDIHNKTANMGLLIRRSSWGLGYGCEAWKAVMDWLFSDGIRKCEAGAYSKNVGMLGIFLKTGMSVEGVRKSSVMLDDGWCDLIEVGKFNDRKRLQRDDRTDAPSVGPKIRHSRNRNETETAGSAG